MKALRLHSVSLGCLLLACASGPEPQANTATTSDTQALPQASEEDSAKFFEQEQRPEVVVRAGLESSAQAIRPGSKFLLAVRFQIEPGYRISWLNPGAQGSQTSVKFTAPEGFEVGPALFPGPTRFTLAGNNVSYGYENETAVFAEVTAPGSLDMSTPYRFDVAARWFACKQTCAKEDLNAFFELMGDRSAPPAELEASLAEHYAKVPTPLEQLADSKHAWQDATLTIEAKGVEWLDFFPASNKVPAVENMNPHGSQLLLRFQRPKQFPHPVRGVAMATVDGQTRYIDVDVPWPEPGG